MTVAVAGLLDGWHTRRARVYGGSTMPPVRDLDVTVVGGGPAGATAARLLAERGARVVLLEARRGDGLRRRGAVALWAMCLVLLALLTLVRVWANLDSWSDLRILMGIVSVGNFLFGAGLLVRWLLWRPAPG